VPAVAAAVRAARVAGTGPVARRLLPVAVVAALFVVPQGVDVVFSAYYLNLLTWVLIFGLFAMALDLSLGLGGLVSFGHAAFFGAGAYAAGLLLKYVVFSLWASLGAAVLAAAGVAAVVSYFAVGSRGVYLAMLTFAFAQLLYETAIKWVAVTGGSDGLPGAGRPPLTLGPVTVLEVAEREQMYYLVAAFVVLGYAACRRIARSPFGAALVAVRENEARAAAIGIDVVRHKRLALVISGALSGLAGALFAIFQNFVSPELLFWSMSGEVVIMALLGGLGTLYGGMIGALIAVGFREVLSTYTDDWLVFLGALYVLCVMCFPQGLVRLGAGRAERRRPAELAPVEARR
jgi:branched-chain amino acid transport system permease protein